MSKLLALFCITAIALICQCSAYTDKESEALNKVRAEVGNDFTQDYMKQDEYLVPWLKVKNWNADEATSLLKKSMKWRQESKADTIMDDLWEKCSNVYPMITDVVTKSGEPVVAVRASEWDIRRRILTGKVNDLSRCLIWFLEVMASKIRAQNEKVGAHNVTQFNNVIDLAGFNTQQHLCIQCATLYLESLKLYEANYPAMLHKVYFINAPGLFQKNLDTVKGMMSETTRKAISVYGFEKDQWQKVLLNDIPADQLPVQFGGERKRKLSQSHKVSNTF